MFFIWIFLFGIAKIFCEDFYSFTVKDAQGYDVSLEQYRGKVNKLYSHERKHVRSLYFRLHWLLM